MPNQLFDGANGENEDETNSTINNFECIEDLNLQVCDEEFEDYMHQEFEKLFTVIWGQDLANDMLILEEQPSPEDNFKSNIAPQLAQVLQICYQVTDWRNSRCQPIYCHFVITWPLP